MHWPDFEFSPGYLQLRKDWEAGTGNNISEICQSELGILNQMDKQFDVLLNSSLCGIPLVPLTLQTFGPWKVTSLNYKFQIPSAGMATVGLLFFKRGIFESSVKKMDLLTQRKFTK